MKKKSTKIAQPIAKEDNAKIIALIKSKINPLHAKVVRLLVQKNIFPKIKYDSSSKFGCRKKIKTPELVQQTEYQQFENQATEPQQNIIQRAKIFIEEKKKKLTTTQPTVRIDLSEYLDLFEPINFNQPKFMKEFMNVRRQSYSNIKSVDQPFHFNENKTHVFSRMEEDEQKEMNAKIRRRINHKKMIALSKNK